MAASVRTLDGCLPLAAREVTRTPSPPPPNGGAGDRPELPDPEPDDPDDDRPYRLNRLQRYGCLALLLGLFFFGSGAPVWQNPFDVDWAVWLSYLPIPLLVLACLLYSGRFSGVAMFLNTLELTLVKFAITYGFSIFMWALSGGPPPRPAWQPHMSLGSAAPAPPGPEPAPRPTPWPDQQRGTLSGQLRNAAGEPVRGALVYVSGGLEAVQAPVPAEAAVLAIGAQTDGAVLVARQYQVLKARSADGRMHNLVASATGRVLFNVPLLADGAEQPIKPPPPHEPIELRCMVHAPGGWHATLLIARSPHHQHTDAEGRFTLPGVPALPLTVTALQPGVGRATQSLALKAGEHAKLTLRLPAP